MFRIISASTVTNNLFTAAKTVRDEGRRRAAAHAPDMRRRDRAIDLFQQAQAGDLDAAMCIQENEAELQLAGSDGNSDWRVVIRYKVDAAPQRHCNCPDFSGQHLCKHVQLLSALVVNQANVERERECAAAEDNRFADAFDYMVANC